MNMYETWTWDISTHDMVRGHVWTCMKLGHGACLCDFCYRLMVMVGVWCQTCGIMFRWWISTIFVLKLLKSFGDVGSVRECWRLVSNVKPMIKRENNWSKNKQLSDFILFWNYGFNKETCRKVIEVEVVIMFSKSCVRLYGKNAHSLCS
jgi:hypothetical protein